MEETPECKAAHRGALQGPGMTSSTGGRAEKKGGALWACPLLPGSLHHLPDSHNDSLPHNTSRSQVGFCLPIQPENVHLYILATEHLPTLQICTPCPTFVRLHALAHIVPFTRNDFLHYLYLQIHVPQGGEGGGNVLHY